MSDPARFYAFSGDLPRADRVPVYAVVDNEGALECASTVFLRREGPPDQPYEFDVPLGADDVTWSGGLATIRAAATPGSQVTYDYLLLREIGFVDRRSDELHAAPDQNGRIVGLTHWDRYEVAMVPGHYFVSARSGAGPGAKTALLAGPYEHHLQALIRVQAAKQLALAEYPGGFGDLRESVLRYFEAQCGAW